jgi:hypothetical protein
MSTGSCARFTTITFTYLSSRVMNNPFVHGEAFIKKYKKKKKCNKKESNTHTNEQTHRWLNAQSNKHTKKQMH